MASAVPSTDFHQNRLLSLLMPEVQQRLVPLLERVSLGVGDMLSQADVPITIVYFPTSLVSSCIKTMEDGATVEVATVGNEGLVGMPLFLESQHELVDMIVQIDGEAIRMTAEDFSKTVQDGSTGLRSILLRYTQATMSQIVQNSACNHSHTIGQRCARWILMTQDRVVQDSFVLADLFLSYMLAVPEAEVANALRTLSEAHLITDHLHKIHVIDRAGLERASCECYGRIKREYDRLLSSR